MKVEIGQRYFWKEYFCNFNSFPEDTEEQRAIKAAAILSGFILHGPYTVVMINTVKVLLTHENLSETLEEPLDSKGEMKYKTAWILHKEKLDHV